jgi:Predicted hydrolases or acyltransferases (alpha/beta hydrolase superfamily)
VIPSDYLDYSGRADALSGGARLIPIETPSGPYRVWTKRTGNNPDLKVLLLHGGPGSTHEYLEAVDSYLPAAGVEYYFYDQLGSGRSDQPDDETLWDLDRFVDEVEQVRAALGLYNAYAEKVLTPGMDQDKLAAIKQLEADGDVDNPRYLELLMEQHYVQHVLRMPPEEWPDPVQRGFAHINAAIYRKMQGPSELGISADATDVRTPSAGALPALPGRQPPWRSTTTSRSTSPACSTSCCRYRLEPDLAATSCSTARGAVRRKSLSRAKVGVTTMRAIRSYSPRTCASNCSKSSSGTLRRDAARNSSGTPSTISAVAVPRTSRQHGGIATSTVRATRGSLRSAATFAERAAVQKTKLASRST